ncbi:MAG: hypothetical protein ACREU7_13730 [Burkholderiales bacterium]
MRRWIVRLAVAILPFLATILFAFLTMEGHLNFGGGEKDIFLSLPLLLWSMAFFVSSLIAWWRKATLGRAAVMSATLATGLVVLLWVSALAYVLMQSTPG